MIVLRERFDRPISRPVLIAVGTAFFLWVMEKDVSTRISSGTFSYVVSIEGHWIRPFAPADLRDKK